MKRSISIPSLLLKVIFLLISFNIYSETLIIQSSDQHSQYKRMPVFLASLEVLTRRFKQEHPNGSVILVINGDFSSFDKDTKFKDQGNFGYLILSRLSEKYEIIYTFGNHDGFDSFDPNLFVNQMYHLKEHNVHLVVANTTFVHPYDELFSPYIDITLSRDHKMRFIGYTLYSTRKRKKLSKTKGILWSQVIKEFTRIEPTTLLEQANQEEGVSSVALTIHWGMTKTKELLNKLNSELTEKLRVVFAADDHKKETWIQNGVSVIDSNAYFDFSQVLLDDSGKVLTIDFFDEHSQKTLAPEVQKESLEAHLIVLTQEFLSQAKQSNNLIPIYTDPIKKRPANRNDKVRCVNAFQGERYAGRR